MQLSKVSGGVSKASEVVLMIQHRQNVGAKTAPTPEAPRPYLLSTSSDPSLPLLIHIADTFHRQLVARIS